MKRIVKITSIIILVLFIIFVGIVSYFYHQAKKEQEQITNLANFLNQIQQEKHHLESQDKIGGKTPEETLQLFIEALEKKDYELASKYFVLEKQEKWRGIIRDIIESDKINDFVLPLEKIEFSNGEYSEDRKKFFVEDPVYLQFIKYPSGVWKIEEI